MLDPALASPIPSLEAIGTPIIAPLPDMEPDIIPGLLPRKGQLVLAGETNVGKSLLALEICSTLCTGRPLWGELDPKFMCKKILYVLGEHYNEVIQRLWQVTSLPMTDQVFIIGPEQLGYDKWLVAQGKPNPQAIEKFKRWTEGVDFIVFDPLSAFVTGVDTENDNVQMRLALDTMSLIAQTCGASCLVLAHQGKPMLDHQTGKERSRKSYAIRGASAIEDAATNIFYMSVAQGGSDAAGRVGDAKIFDVTCRKYKGIAPPKYTLLRDNGNLNHSLLGSRPWAETQKILTQAKVTRIQMAIPELTITQTVKIIAATEAMGESTIWSYLGK